MTKIIVVFFILVLAVQISPQELAKNGQDSLYNLFTFVRGINTSERIQQQLDENPETIKCGFELVNTIKQNLESFSIEQKSELTKLLVRPQTQTSIVSPNGFFRIHYDLNGNNAMGFDINLLLQAVDSVYSYEISSLGFLPPPSDDTSGGDGKYDIYVLNIADYGYTQSENKIENSRWTSFIVMDNDYGTGFNTHGIEAASVTVAHEFHHAIQMGSYAPTNYNSPYRSEDLFFYELTSTSFEEFVFDGVNDYYAYMSSYFNHPELPMPNQSGYNMAIWNIYLQKNFGFDIIKRQWVLMPEKRALECIALSINEISSTFGNELNKFGIWTYFTKSRTIPGRYFEEAEYYPLIISTATESFTPPSDTYNMTLGPVSNYFLKINLSIPDGIFNSIITNSDWQKAIENVNQTFTFSYSIFSDTVSGNPVINDKYSVLFSENGQPFWNNAGILNDVVIYGDSSYSVPNLEGETYAYPIPFKLSSQDFLNIDFQSDLNTAGEVDLNIYSAGLELYFSGKKSVQPPYSKNSKKYYRITLSKTEANFPTGVYIYIIKSGEDIYKGKLVIFNE